MNKLILYSTCYNILAFLLIVSSDSEIKFECGGLDNLAPSTSGAPFQLSLFDQDNIPTGFYHKDSYVSVQLKFSGSLAIRSIMIQANKVLEKQPVGSWKVVQPQSKLDIRSCVNTNDTLIGDKRKEQKSSNKNNATNNSRDAPDLSFPRFKIQKPAGAGAGAGAGF
ncbi:hypothetical protein HELRODRAFT_160177 [Helobdella robusta]|uniref:Reelin domain-containing protein n=1 Tax=Helobdella robusta TaxID=6412 RepID=T1EPX5_HELRO|nr:hypothetical protein HELRODRAFT_160177 [Helobdella robusta]ESO06054.1 hypothetical protein HELRODRAFT_160177 [Helobdella robusta]